MKNVNEIKELCEKVVTLLRSHSHLRDSDKRLVANIWVLEVTSIYKKPIENISSLEFLNCVAEGKLTNYDSISRARRKVQEQYPDLRGTKYKEKQDEAKDTRKNINK
jgi:hypothetical protein